MNLLPTSNLVPKKELLKNIKEREVRFFQGLFYNSVKKKNQFKYKLLIIASGIFKYKLLIIASGICLGCFGFASY